MAGLPRDNLSSHEMNLEDSSLQFGHWNDLLHSEGRGGAWPKQRNSTATDNICFCFVWSDGQACHRQEHCRWIVRVGGVKRSGVSDCRIHANTVKAAEFDLTFTGAPNMSGDPTP